MKHPIKNTSSQYDSRYSYPDLGNVGKICADYKPENGIELEKQIVEDNRVYLVSVMQNAPDIYSGFTGLGRRDFRQSFKKLLIAGDMYFLPYCLLFIYMGTQSDPSGRMISSNKKFVVENIKKLHEACYSKTISYFYAYFLGIDGNFEESVKILNSLVEKEFSPAMVTIGDLKRHCGDYQEAKELYTKAKDLGNGWGRGRLRSFIRNEQNFIQRLGTDVLGIIYSFKGIFDTTLTQQRGERFLFLDFQYCD